MKIKKIKAVPYDSNWPQLYEKEAASIKETLKEHCIEMYHIGSTSIEGMSAKPTIDMITVVDRLENSLLLEKLGYDYRGELNIPLRYYFSKHTLEIRFNHHVVEKDHGFIKINLSFRDYLRAHPKDKEEYSKLKEKLLQDPNSYIAEGGKFSNYNSSKDSFIKEILKKAGYEGLNLNFCMHEGEWREYHRIRKEQIFDPIEVEYDKKHPTVTAKNHFHFVLYKGTEIVSCGHIELLNEDEAALRTLSTDEKVKGKGYGGHLLDLLEKWVSHQRRKVIKLHANTPYVSFYQKRGYQEMSFDDECIHDDYVDLGKDL